MNKTVQLLISTLLLNITLVSCHARKQEPIMMDGVYVSSIEPFSDTIIIHDDSLWFHSAKKRLNLPWPVDSLFGIENHQTNILTKAKIISIDHNLMRCDGHDWEREKDREIELKSNIVTKLLEKTDANAYTFQFHFPNLTNPIIIELLLVDIDYENYKHFYCDSTDITISVPVPSSLMSNNEIRVGMNIRPLNPIGSNRQFNSYDLGRYRVDSPYCFVFSGTNNVEITIPGVSDRVFGTLRIQDEPIYIINRDAIFFKGVTYNRVIADAPRY